MIMSLISKIDTLINVSNNLSTDSLQIDSALIDNVGLASSHSQHFFLISLACYAFLTTIVLVFGIVYLLNKRKKGTKSMDGTIKVKDAVAEIEHAHGLQPQKNNKIEAFGLDGKDATRSEMPIHNSFATSNSGWTVVGASVIGKSHISMKLPCQDYNKYEYLGDGWGVAVTSDGAGSAKHSEIGSKITVERAVYYFKDVINQKEWIKLRKLPTEAEWQNITFLILKAIRDDIEHFATIKGMEFKSLSATIVVVIHSPIGFLTTHVGDGRAGFKAKDGQWTPLITPHKGEEANQTLFMTSEFWNIPYYVASGVAVPESHVIRCTPQAFTLMSDGCEHTAWLCYQKNEETGMFYDPNLPFQGFYDPIVEQLYDDVSNEQNKERWSRFISDGDRAFVNEPDDKTMIVGVFKEAK